MRMILSLSALVLGVGAHAAPPRPAAALAPSPALNAEALAGALQGRFDTAQATRDNSQVNCRGRIETAREERGLPKLQKDDAKPDAPLFIAAVDKMIDGCEVLVMRDNLSDIRPLPEFQEGSGELTPLTGQ
jgi:hypothetical protein